MAKISQNLNARDTDPVDDRDYLSSICPLKKHRGESWRQVVETDPDYVLWVLRDSEVKLGKRLVDELTWALEEQG